MSSRTMKHVFGPVPSRRLGMSLGVDPIPLKTCNFSCVYCQLGRSRDLARRRRAFCAAGDLAAEVATALSHEETGAVDWITFVGSGETTLYSRLGSAVRSVKALTDHLVAVITNGSLLHLSGVRDELAAADAVLPSLDAGTEDLYRRVNRPRGDLTFKNHVDGLVAFRRMYRGELWVEVMLLGGINDTDAARRNIASVLRMVEPDEIHLATPTRPSAEPWIEAPGPDGLERAVSILGGVAKVLEPISVERCPAIDGDLAETLLAIIRRHPLQEAEVEGLLNRWAQMQAEESLAALIGGGEIQVVERYGRRFWCAAGLRYPDPLQEAVSVQAS